jgi:hypothetical protein
MEVKRLANSCTRLIDLRGHVDGECREFEHEGRVHFIDDIAIKVFLDNIKAYQSYTFGVYEAVMNTENNFRVIYQKEKSSITKPVQTETAKIFEKTQYPAQLFPFGPYYNRCEERMNFAIPIQVFLENKKEIDCSSSDISINGCKFRFNRIENIKVGQILNIRFSGLEEDFQFGKDNTFAFEVRNIQQLDKLQLIGCQRVYIKAQGVDGFKQFLQGFIQGNKRRYKINLDNTINALQARSYEQFSLPKSNELPIFIKDIDGEVSPRYVLTCHNNQPTFQYWQDENRHSTLNCLVTPERLSRMKAATNPEKSIVVYSFIHKSKDKSYFYTADNIQLSPDNDFMKQFLGFAAGKASFTITQLSLIEVDERHAESPFTLSNALNKKDQYLNLPIPDDVYNTLNYLPYIVVASDITTSDIIKQYQQLSYENIETSRLKNFGHKRLPSPLSVDEVGINYKNQRQEPRFTYKTPAELEIEGVNFSGNSHDFSTLGLKVELDKPSVLNKNDIVYITFPALQKITSAFELKGLPYEVMRVNKKKTVINLRVFVEQHQHIGRRFFKALIKKNRDKLTSDEYSLMSPGLAKALRNIYSRNIAIPSLMVQISGSRYKIEAIGCSKPDNELFDHMKRLTDRKPFYNLYPLLNNAQATSFMAATLKKMQADDIPITDTLYIAINPKSDMVDQGVTTKLDTELQSPMLKRMFITNALKRGSFICVQVKLSRTDEPDMDHLNPELSYISSYAIHRGKQIEQDIWSVSGVVQVIDITKETLIRYGVLK